MFNEIDTKKVVEDKVLTKPVIEKLLNIYIGEADWWPSVGRLHKILSKRLPQDEATKRLRQCVSFTIVFPLYDRSVQLDKDNFENNLFRMINYHQVDEKDWFAEVQKIVKQDNQISKDRKKILELGVIDGIQFQPFCRQAFKWLCESAKDQGVEVNDELKKKFRLLVMAYGGVIISYIYEKHPKDIKKKVINFKSGYFFEKLIHELYTLEQILKIKKNEIEQTNPKWIKSIR